MRTHTILDDLHDLEILDLTVQELPDCQLIGEDGNIFNLIGIAARTLRQNGLDTQAEEMRERIMGGECRDYSAALNVIGEYVNITGPKEYGMEMGGM